MYGKLLIETLTKEEPIFCIHLWAWTWASSVLKGSSATLPSALGGRCLQREGKGTTVVPISIPPCGGIDQTIWNLDTKKYLLTFNAGQTSGDTVDT